MDTKTKIIIKAREEMKKQRLNTNDICPVCGRKLDSK